MSTSLLYHAFGIRGYDYTRTDSPDGQTVFTIHQDPKTCRCSAFGSPQVQSRGRVERRFRTVPIGSRATFVVLPIPRVQCQACGAIRQFKVPFADPRRSYTSSFERYTLELGRRMTIRDVALHLGVSWDVIKDIQKRDLSRRFAKPKLKHLRRIAIDEIAIAKGHRDLTVVMDLQSGAVVFVGDGKGADARKPFWKRLRPSRAKIEAVAMAMSAAYRGAVSTHLPKAKIVFDRFHVVKLFNEKLSDLRRALHREATEVMHKEVLKGTRWLLLKNPENLDAEKDEKRRLEEGAGPEQAAGDGLLHEGRLEAVLGATREAVRDRVAGRLDRPCGGVRGQDAPADGQDAVGAPQWPAGVRRCDDHERADGGDEQHDQDDEATSLWVPGPRVLQAQDPGDPRDEVQIDRIS